MQYYKKQGRKNGRRPFFRPYIKVLGSPETLFQRRGGVAFARQLLQFGKTELRGQGAGTASLRYFAVTAVSDTLPPLDSVAVKVTVTVSPTYSERSKVTKAIIASPPAVMITEDSNGTPSAS